MHFPITVGVRRSFILGIAVVFVHVAAIALLFLPGWPLPASAGGTLLLLVSALYSWRRCTPAVEALRLFADGRVQCRRYGKGDFEDAELLPGATVHPALTVLRLVCQGEILPVVLLPDNGTAEENRRLRVWLRWRGSPPEANSGFR